MDNLARKSEFETKVLFDSEQTLNWIKEMYGVEIDNIFIEADSKYHFGDSIASAEKNIFLIKKGSFLAENLKGKVRKIDDDIVLGKNLQFDDVQKIYNNLSKAANDDLFEPKIRLEPKIGLNNNLNDDSFSELPKIKENKYDEIKQTQISSIQTQDNKIEYKSQELTNPLKKENHFISYDTKATSLDFLAQRYSFNPTYFGGGLESTLNQRTMTGGSLDISYGPKTYSRKY